MKIHLAKIEDIEGIIELDKSDDYYDFATSPRILLRAIERGQLLICISEEEKIIGYIRYGFLWDLETPFIEMIRVLPSLRRKGIAELLIQNLVNKLKNEDEKYDNLISALNSTNEISKKFHEKMGFKQIGKIDLEKEGLTELFYRLDFEKPIQE